MPGGNSPHDAPRHVVQAPHPAPRHGVAAPHANTKSGAQAPSPGVYSPHLPAGTALAKRDYGYLALSRLIRVSAACGL